MRNDRFASTTDLIIFGLENSMKLTSLVIAVLVSCLAFAPSSAQETSAQSILESSIIVQPVQTRLYGDANALRQAQANDLEATRTEANGFPRGGLGSCAFPIGDVNRDGNVDLLDIAPFISLLIAGEFQCEADTNEDGAVNLLDVCGLVPFVCGGGL